MDRRRPTIADVARTARVSVGTVSNYLNGTANVRPETKSRIDQAVQDLAYRRSTFARALSLGGVLRVSEHRSTMPRLVVVGYISVDYMCRVDVLPHRDDRVTAQRIEKALGGPAANLAVAAAGIGSNGTFGMDVELATALGDDPDSDWALGELARKGVHAFPIRRPVNNRLSRCIVFIEPNGSRTIVNEPFELSDVDLADHVRLAPEERPRCLHIEGYHYERMHESIERFRQAGWKITLHSAGLPASARTPEGFMDIVARCDVTFAGHALIREIFDFRMSDEELPHAVADRLSKMKARGHFVLTLGPSGAVVFPAEGSAPVRAAALPVRVIDATGAGDSFAGVFLAYWLNGASLEAAARFAAAAGSLTTTAEGAQGAVASHEDLLASLADRPLRRAS
ncbi:carbohydrate kinase family protein [Aureimonas sp. AU22]|uniref:carbohydrate kinase family protein n=1 Tax=Aureimonas sp. AU22 TaxID=1638162 RepID=UPI0007822DE2|nr:PfkB family carbohydrate kinase [Aureimonas sp. AU22]